MAWGLAAAQMLLRLLTHGNYGVFRDEFYYLACADHLAWGYVDHPPLSIALLWLQRAVFGDSVIALRLLPTLAGGFLVLMTAVLARELGGGRFAQGLAALAAATVPQYLGLTGFYSMNAIDLVVWVLALWLVARVVITGDPRLWLALGLVAGLGLLNKISVLFLGIGLVVGLLATPLRQHLRSGWLWLGGGLAGLLFLPHVIWQMVHGWPTLEFIANAKRFKIATLSPVDFLAAQVMEMSPFVLPLWLAGLLYLLFGKEGRRFQVLGLIYVAVLVVLIVQRSKPYYLAPAYPVLLAAGCVVAGRLLAQGRRRWLRPVLVVLLLLSGALTAPMAAPILPVERFIAYQRALGTQPVAAENSALGPLAQHFADRFGWQELTAAVVAVWESLPEDERRDALIVTSNYGEAGALLYYGRHHDLPPATSQHNNFFLWGPGEASGNVVILVGVSPNDEGLRATFDDITVAGRFESPYAMPYETRHPILVARGLKIPLEEAWLRGKRFI